MANEQIIKKILERIENHEKRIRALEEFSSVQAVRINQREGKQTTLREIVKGRKFKNGQEQVAVIVGYHENILGTLIKKDNIKSEWTNAKMTNKYSTEFIARAKDVLIRVQPDGTCDLTQTGEEFFEKFLKNEPTESTS